MKISKDGTVTKIEGQGDIIFGVNNIGIKIDARGLGNISVSDLVIVRLHGSRLRKAITAFIIIWRKIK